MRWDLILSVAIPVVVTFLGAVLGARYQFRQSKLTQGAEDRKIDLSSYKEQIEQWRQDVQNLREYREQDQAQYEQRIAEIQRELHRLGTQLDRQTRQVELLTEWARGVIEVMRDHDLAYPEPPAGVI